jgi:hypothetical protein
LYCVFGCCIRKFVFQCFFLWTLDSLIAVEERSQLLREGGDAVRVRLIYI